MPPPLEAVLRLADQKNAQLVRLRKTVADSETAAAVAEHAHLPDCMRTEEFRRSKAEARLWQDRVELAKVRTEVLQDAGTTYVDWLTALRGEAITLELQGLEEKLLERARALAKDEKSALSLVEALEMTVSGRKESAARLRQQAEAAAAKLAYLLGSCAGPPFPSDATLVPVDLVDATRPVESLVHQALENGPGVWELLGLQAAVEKAAGRTRPLQKVCNLTGCCPVCGRVSYAFGKVDEVRLAREDQAGKLRLGVVEARSAILAGREQIAQASEQVRHAAEAYRLADIHVKDTLNPGTLGEATQSIRGLEAAHFASLQAVAAYDKAQVRLLLVLGLADGCRSPAP
jgi:hypothetical protein